MGLFLRQDAQRSELQTKIASDLKERLKERAVIPETEHEPAFLENKHETRAAGMWIIVLLFVFFGVVVWAFMVMAGIV